MTRYSSGFCRTMFYSGYPLPGYNNIEESRQDQQAAMKQLHVDQLSDFLADRSTVGDMDMYYSSDGIEEHDTHEQRRRDLLLLIGSLLFAFVFLFLQFESLWLTFWTLFAGFGNYIWGNMVYRIVMNVHFFGLPQALSCIFVFVLTAIFANYFLDAFREAHVHQTAASRMSISSISGHKNGNRDQASSTAATAAAAATSATTPAETVGTAAPPSSSSPLGDTTASLAGPSGSTSASASASQALIAPNPASSAANAEILASVLTATFKSTVTHLAWIAIALFLIFAVACGSHILVVLTYALFCLCQVVVVMIGTVVFIPPMVSLWNLRFSSKPLPGFKSFGRQRADATGKPVQHPLVKFFGGSYFTRFSGHSAIAWFIVVAGALLTIGFLINAFARMGVDKRQVSLWLGWGGIFFFIIFVGKRKQARKISKHTQTNKQPTNT